MPGPSEPYEPGNLAAVRHGAYSARLVATDASEILEQLAEDDPPWLHAVDQAALEAWAFTEAQVRRLREFVDINGPLDHKGKPRPAADLLLRFEKAAERARAALGFDPRSRMALGRDAAMARAISDRELGGVVEAGRELRLAAGVDGGDAA